MTLFGTDDPERVVQRAKAASSALMKIVREQNMNLVIDDKEYLLVEAWTMLGSMVGVFPITSWTRRMMDGDRVLGWEARVEARTIGGALVGGAESMCLRDEERWSEGPEFALRSMAQTRAQSKALAAPLRFIAKLAGVEGTPGEEMDGVRRGGAAPGAGTTRPYAEGDACPTCLAHPGKKMGKFQIAKGGRNAGQLQCTGKLADGSWANHPAPISQPEAAAADARETGEPIPFEGERPRLLPPAYREALVAKAASLPRPGVLAILNQHGWSADLHLTVSEWAELIDLDKLAALGKAFGMAHILADPKTADPVTPADAAGQAAGTTDESPAQPPATPAAAPPPAEVTPEPAGAATPATGGEATGLG